jgi:alkylation response protein AidB-like acyl-CoA dehydrogenase
VARSNGRASDPVIRQALAQAYAELEILRFNQLRMLTALANDAVPGPTMSIGKLYWSNWHRRLGELGMDVRGATAMCAGPDGHAGSSGYVLDGNQRTFLYSRAHTIYAGSNEVQRNVLAERVLALPRDG